MVSGPIYLLCLLTNNAKSFRKLIIENVGISLMDENIKGNTRKIDLFAKSFSKVLLDTHEHKDECYPKKFDNIHEKGLSNMAWLMYGIN